MSFGMRLLWVSVVGVLCCSCDAEFSLGEREPHNAAPYANAGTGSTFFVESTITVDGSGSFDSDGRIGFYQWSIVDQPVGSTSILATPTAVTSTVFLDKVGIYTFELTVSDDRGDIAKSRVAVRSVAPVLTVMAGDDRAVRWRENVQLAGSFFADQGITPTIRWSFASKPPNSAAVLTNSQTLAPSFVADADGTYVVSLVATTPHTQRADSVTIVASAIRKTFTYSVADVEYSTALDRLILATDAPPRLRLVDPETGTEDVITLGAAPYDLSITPDGLRAAVTHDHSLSIVNLQTRAVTSTHATAYGRFRAAIDGSSRVHLFGFDGFAFVYPGTLDIASNTTQGQTFRPVDEGSYARVNPSNTAVYVVDVSGNNRIDRFSISTFPLSFSRMSQSAQVQSNLWFTSDGTALITHYGNVYRVSEDPDLDMTLIQRLPGDEVHHVNGAASSTSTNRLVTASSVYPYPTTTPPSYEQVRVYNATTFALLEAFPLPDNGVGRLTALRSDGTKAYVLAAVGQEHVLYTVAFPP